MRRQPSHTWWHGLVKKRFMSACMMNFTPIHDLYSLSGLPTAKKCLAAGIF